MALDGKVALVTGGGSGIGRASAIMLAEEGCKVAVVDFDRQQAVQTVVEIEKLCGEGVAIGADVSDATAMATAVAEVLSRWDHLDIIFANAGINGVWAPLEEITPEEWDRTLNTNLKGTFLTVKYALPALKERGGSIIITSSINGTRIFSNSGATAYSCSKAAQVAFAKMAALELAKHNIRVNVICPGAISSHINERTEQRHLERAREPVEYPAGLVPLTDGKPGSPYQVAQLVVFLASDASIHITGTEIFIDGAESLLQG